MKKVETSPQAVNQAVGPMINLVVALSCEARPLIRYYALEALESAGRFCIYAAEGMHLIVSGVGKTAALAAPARLRALQAEPAGAWLNLGVAGHGRCAVGVPLLAHRVVDAGSGQAYYPVFAFPLPCATTTVCTVDEAETRYARPWAYDMEASAFCSAARRFASAELVHCLKIVSDAPATPLEGRLSKRKVEALVEGQLGLIDQVVETLSALGAQLRRLHAEPPLLARCLEKWRFSVSQQHQLRRLLQDWHTLNPGAGLWTAEFQALQSGAQVLCFLEASIASRAPPF